MSTMVEKVAQAITDAFTNGNVQFEDVEEHHRRPYLEAARAAIEAMMEPTEGMLIAGRDVDVVNETYDIFTAMIQAALKEEA